MSDLLSDRERQKVPANLRIGSPAKTHPSREDVDESQVPCQLKYRIIF